LKLHGQQLLDRVSMRVVQPRNKIARVQTPEA